MPFSQLTGGLLFGFGPHVHERRADGMVERSQRRSARRKAGKVLWFPIHPHMLRHACGYYLANADKDTRGLAGRFPSSERLIEGTAIVVRRRGFAT
jgi:integrase